MKTANPIYKPARKTKARYRILYGGAGSGKSVFTSQDELSRVAEKEVRTLTVRKVRATVKNSTFQQYRDVLSALNWIGAAQVNKTDYTIDFHAGGRILHAGLDDPEKLKSITSVNRVWIEEANELDEEDFNQLDLRLRGESDIPFQITLTFNPNVERAHWLRRRFPEMGSLPKYTPGKPCFLEEGDVYVQRTTYLDNPWAGEEYGRVLGRLPDAWRAVYMRGEFYDIADPDQVIHYDWIKRAFDLDPTACEGDGKGRLGVDVARYGDDRTTLARMQGYVLKELRSSQGQDTTKTTAQAHDLIDRYGIAPKYVAVDTVGIGAGVADNLRAMGLAVQGFKGGEAPVEDGKAQDTLFTFKNRRSQMWWHLRTLLKEGRMALAIDRNSEEAQRLVEDFTAPKYRISGDKVLEVEPKQGTKNWGLKERLGRSTDEGDAVGQAAFVDRLEEKEKGGVLFA